MTARNNSMIKLEKHANYVEFVAPHAEISEGIADEYDCLDEN